MDGVPSVKYVWFHRVQPLSPCILDCSGQSGSDLTMTLLVSHTLVLLLLSLVVAVKQPGRELMQFSRKGKTVSQVSHCTVLYCTVLYCTVLYCTVLYCTVLYCTVLYCTVLYCTVLYCTVLYCTVLYCTVLYCTVQESSGNIHVTLREAITEEKQLFYGHLPQGGGGGV